MARPKRDPNAVPTQTRVLEAAEHAFASHGFAAARLSDIATDAGISRPSLLYHFESKDVLYEAVVGRTFDALGAALAEPMQAEAPFDVRLRQLVDTFVHVMAANPHGATILVRELIGPGGAPKTLLVEMGTRLLDTVEGWVADQGQSYLRDDVHPRGVIMQIVSDTLLRQAAGPEAAGLWGDADDHATRLAEALLIRPGEGETT